MSNVHSLGDPYQALGAALLVDAKSAAAHGEPIEALQALAWLIEDPLAEELMDVLHIDQRAALTWCERAALALARRAAKKRREL